MGHSNARTPPRAADYQASGIAVRLVHGAHQIGLLHAPLLRALPWLQPERVKLRAHSSVANQKVLPDPFFKPLHGTLSFQKILFPHRRSHCSRQGDTG